MSVERTHVVGSAVKFLQRMMVENGTPAGTTCMCRSYLPAGEIPLLRWQYFPLKSRAGLLSCCPKRKIPEPRGRGFFLNYDNFFNSDDNLHPVGGTN